MKRLERGEFRCVAGRWYGTPKELWGFRSDVGGRDPVATAQRFLKANADLLGLRPELETLRLRPPRVLKSLGATHVIFQQSLAKLRVHRGYVTVHIGRDGRPYLVKNRAVPPAMAPRSAQRPKRDERAAVKRAAAELALPMRRAKPSAHVETLWFPVRDGLRLAHKVRLAKPNRGEEWIVYVDANDGRVLSRYDNMAARRAKARVFDPNPVIALGDHRAVTTVRGEPRKKIPAPAYQSVTLLDLDESGFLQGKRVSTELTHGRTNRKDGPYEYWTHEKGQRTAFKEVMAYHHVDGACRYLEELGYEGQRAIFKAPIRISVNGTRIDGSFYSPEDGSLLFGTGGVDDAEDADVILHEFGHALQDAIVPDFGQSLQAAAIGEGFGDYWAASSFARKKSKKYETSVMTWDGVGETDRDPPCVRRVDEAFGFEDFIHEEDFEHDNGQIWSATLWEIRKAIGRKRADKIIVESHFQLDGFTTFARAARAILDANRLLDANHDRERLVRIFTRRGIAPVD